MKIKCLTKIVITSILLLFSGSIFSQLFGTHDVDIEFWPRKIFIKSDGKLAKISKRLLVVMKINHENIRSVNIRGIFLGGAGIKTKSNGQPLVLVDGVRNRLYMLFDMEAVLDDNLYPVNEKGVMTVKLFWLRTIREIVDGVGVGSQVSFSGGSPFVTVGAEGTLTAKERFAPAELLSIKYGPARHHRD